MDEQACANCRHWEATPESHDPHRGHCACPKFVYEEETPEDGLQYWDYESYSAGFWTGPKFSCVHWAARPEG